MVLCILSDGHKVIQEGLTVELVLIQIKRTQLRLFSPEEGCSGLVLETLHLMAGLVFVSEELEKMGRETMTAAQVTWTWINSKFKYRIGALSSLTGPLVLELLMFAIRDIMERNHYSQIILNRNL